MLNCSDLLTTPQTHRVMHSDRYINSNIGPFLLHSPSQHQTKHHVSRQLRSPPRRDLRPPCPLHAPRPLLLNPQPQLPRPARPHRRPFLLQRPRRPHQRHLYGISRDWLVTAQETWASPSFFSWRAHERRQNAFPQFKINITVPSDGEPFELHFAALFSTNKSAVPITLLHGWPGSWSEFAGVLDLLAKKYTAETLPYHVVVPSIPDYGLSTRPGETTGGKEVTMERASEALNELMKALGFKRYVAQGGDVGSFLAQTMCRLFEECRAFHCEFCHCNLIREIDRVTGWF